MRDTIDMAREAWISEAEAEMLQSSEECYLSCTYLADLKAFEALVRADERSVEREACAKVCDDLAPPCGYNLTEISFWDVTSLECAAAIRARGEASIRGNT
jgi:hypothetical protein